MSKYFSRNRVRVRFNEKVVYSTPMMFLFWLSPAKVFQILILWILFLNERKERNRPIRKLKNQVSVFHIFTTLSIQNLHKFHPNFIRNRPNFFRKLNSKFQKHQSRPHIPIKMMMIPALPLYLTWLKPQSHHVITNQMITWYHRHQVVRI